MGRPAADWKHQRRHALDWLSIALALSIVGVYLYLWSTDGRSPFGGVALAFVLWLALYVTPYWQPVLYLVAALLLAAVTLGMVYYGVRTETVPLVAIGLNVVFAGLATYLFTTEESGL